MTEETNYVVDCSMSAETRIIQLQECKQIDYKLISHCLQRHWHKWKFVLENPYVEVKLPEWDALYPGYPANIITLRCFNVKKKDNGKISLPFDTEMPLDVDIRIDATVKYIEANGFAYEVPKDIRVKPALQL
jgi:hypothetical protein